MTDLDTGLDFEEGGYGNSQLTQENINLILDYNADPVFFGNTEHVFNTGADYHHTAYAFKRDEDVHSTVSFIDSTGRDVLLSELTASKGTVNILIRIMHFMLRTRLKPVISHSVPVCAWNGIII